MKCAAAIFLLGSGAANAQADNDLASDPAFPQFQAFIEEHRGGAGYSTEVETIGRFNAFKSNLKLAEERNRRGALSSKLGQPQETHGVTKFMDLTPQEFNAQYKGLIPMKDKESIPVMMHANAADVKANAQSIDWNSKGVLTPVKNQGHCGSCWAFSATEQLESQYKQKYGTLKKLAPQQITSCDKNDGGCQGGNPINAWRYVSGFGGQELEQNYPYTSGTTGQTGTCKSNKADVSEDTTGQYTMIARSAGQESNMLAQIQKSPMSICVDATLWQTYKGGVITSSSGCAQKRHALCSALAASAVPGLVMARGHKIDEVPELPLVVADGAQGITKTKQAVDLLNGLGLWDEVQKCIDSKKIKCGRGKSRNRRYSLRQGLLVVYDQDDGITRAMRNIPGVESADVSRLNLLRVAPGGSFGRMILWTEAAFKRLTSLYGSFRSGAEEKKGYHLPRPIMLNSDVARIINSDEVQSAVRPAMLPPRRTSQKKNALKNRNIMARLNPGILHKRKIRTLAATNGTKEREALMKKKRARLTEAKKHHKDSKQFYVNMQAAYNVAKAEDAAEEEE